MKNETCINCKYYEAYAQDGICSYYPPTPFRVEAEYEYVRPRTDHDDYCSKFEMTPRQGFPHKTNREIAQEKADNIGEYNRHFE